MTAEVRTPPIHGMSLLLTVLTITLLGFALALSLVLALR